MDQQAGDGAFGGAVKPAFTTDIYQISTFDLYDPNAPTEFFLISKMKTEMIL